MNAGDKIFCKGCLWEGKWRRGDVLNSPLIHCAPVWHCLLCTPCTLSWYSLSLCGRLYTLHNGEWRPHHWTFLVSTLHLQAVETYRDRLLTSLTWKQTGKIPLTNTPLANYPIMHSRLICKDQKAWEKNSKPKIIETTQTGSLLRYANISDTLFDQKSPVLREAVFRNGIHTKYNNWQTLRLGDWIIPDRGPTQRNPWWNQFIVSEFKAMSNWGGFWKVIELV